VQLAALVQFKLMQQEAEFLRARLVDADGSDGVDGEVAQRATVGEGHASKQNGENVYTHRDDIIASG
jgi:hypothetical protein